MWPFKGKKPDPIESLAEKAVEEAFNDPRIEDYLDDIITVLIFKGIVTDDNLEGMLKCRQKKP